MIKKFLLKLMVFCLLPILILYGLQHYTDAGLRKSAEYPFAEWNEIFNGRIKADLVVLGSSRAGHFDTFILDTALNKNSYNIGNVAYAFDMQYAKLQCYLKYNKKPDCILQSLDLFTLEGPKNLYNAKQFLPYLNEEMIRNTTCLYQGAFPRYYYFFPLIKYRNDEDLIPLGIQLYPRHFMPEHLPIKGYKGLNNRWDGSFEKWRLRYPDGYVQPVSEATCKVFDEYLAYCAENKIRVILIYSPELAEAQFYMRNRHEIVTRYSAFARKYKLHFLDYGGHPICKSRDNFYNGTHLNKKGAELFSAVLAADMKQLKD